MLEVEARKSELEVQMDVAFLRVCHKIFNSIYILKDNFSALEYYAIADMNISDLIKKYNSLIKSYPEYKVSKTIIFIVNDFKNNSFIDFLTDDARERVLKKKNIINGVELNEAFVDQVIFELQKRNYQITSGVVFNAAKDVINNSNINEMNFGILDKSSVVERLDARVEAKTKEYEDKGIRMIKNKII